MTFTRRPQACDVGQHVARVRQQSEAAGQHASDDFNEQIGGRERQGEGQTAAVLRTRANSMGVASGHVLLLQAATTGQGRPASMALSPHSSVRMR